MAASDYRRLSAEILRGVLDELGIEQVTVIGGSIGNVWALSLAELHPSRVDRVVLLDHLSQRDTGFRLRAVQDDRQVDVPRLPVIADVFQLQRPDHRLSTGHLLFRHEHPTGFRSCVSETPRTV